MSVFTVLVEAACDRVFGTVKDLPRSQRKKMLYKLIVALNNIRYAREGCELLLKSVNSIWHPLYQPLLHSVVVCYAKPFVENKGLGVLQSRWKKFDNLEYQKTHNDLLAIRKEIVAHSDLEKVQVMMIPPGSSFHGRKHQGQGVGFALSTYTFPLERFKVVWNTIEDLRVRLMRAVEDELRVLYDSSQLPEDPFRLDFTDGL